MTKIINYLKSEKFNNFITLLPIIIFSCIVPFIFGLKIIELKEPVINHWINPLVNIDFFSYYKMLVIVGCAVLALLLFLYHFLKHQIKLKNKLPITLASIFSILIIIASQTSIFKSLALFGAPSRYEGMYTLLSYMVLFIYTLLFIDSMEKIKTLFKVLSISFSIMLFIGTLEFFSFHLIEIGFIRTITGIPESTADNIKDATSSIMSLYSTNNTGQYLCLSIPFILYGYFSKEKAMAKTILIAISYFAVITLLGSYAFASFIAIIISIIVFVILFRKYLAKHLLALLILMVSLSVLLVITNIATDGRVKLRSDILSVSYEMEREEARSNYIHLNNILINKTLIKIDNDYESFYINYAEDQFTILDNNMDTLPMIFNEEDSTYTIDDSHYEPFSFKLYEAAATITVNYEGKSFTLHKDNDRFKVVGYCYNLFDITEIEKTKLQFPPTLFSSRGIIYNGLLPAVRDNIFFGNGPDTALLTYPQNDVIGKINIFGNSIVIVSKPHSLYLQILHDLGLFALLTFIALIALYAIKSFKLYINCEMTEKNMMGMTIAISIMSYLIASTCYDSTVHISPIFWTLLALGIVINNLKEEEE